MTSDRGQEPIVAHARRSAAQRAGCAAGLGAAGLVVARGVIARLALDDSDVEDTPSLSLACREARVHFPSLLVGALIYGACVAFGAVGINAVLRGTDFDLRYVGRRDVTAPARVLALRALDAFVPSPGSPFVEFVPALPNSSFIGTQRLNDTNGDNGYWQHVHDGLYVPASTPVAEGN